MTTDQRSCHSDRLGAPLEVFKPMLGNVIAGFIISALSAAGGTFALVFPLLAAYLAHWDLPFHAEHGWCWFAVGLMIVIGVGAWFIAVTLVIFSKGILSRRLEICANGFRYHSRQSVAEVPWSEVMRIRETVLYERPPVLKGTAKLLLPKMASTNYLVVTATGEEYYFDGNSVRAIKRLGVVLREQADRLSLAWETVEEHA